MTAVFESIASLFMMIITGYVGSKKGIITQEINKGLINILIMLALPFMILASFMSPYGNSVKSNVIKTFYYSLAAYIAMAVLSLLLLLPVKGDKKTVLHFANLFVNTGYVGFPILHSVYGNEGIVYGSVFNLFFVILVWTYGLLLYKGSLDKKELKSELKKVLLNPSIIAVCLGLVILALNIRLPGALTLGIKSIGSMTGPLSMLIIGAILANTKAMLFLKDWTLYYGMIVKLVIIPALVYLLFLLTGDTSKVVYSVVIMTAMPASAMTSIFAESYGKEKEFAAVIVSLTTLLSLLTISLLLMYIEY